MPSDEKGKEILTCKEPILENNSLYFMGSSLETGWWTKEKSVKRKTEYTLEA